MFDHHALYDILDVYVGSSTFHFFSGVFSTCSSGGPHAEPTLQAKANYFRNRCVSFVVPTYSNRLHYRNLYSKLQTEVTKGKSGDSVVGKRMVAVDKGDE